MYSLNIVFFWYSLWKFKSWMRLPLFLWFQLFVTLVKSRRWDAIWLIQCRECWGIYLQRCVLSKPAMKDKSCVFFLWNLPPSMTPYAQNPQKSTCFELLPKHIGTKPPVDHIWPVFSCCLPLSLFLSLSLSLSISLSLFSSSLSPSLLCSRVSREEEGNQDVSSVPCQCNRPMCHRATLQTSRGTQ